MESKATDVDLILHKKNRGIPASQNHAVEVAKGKYFIGSISDDLMLPNRIQDDVDCLERSHDQVVGLFSIAEIFHTRIGDGNDRFMGRLKGFSSDENHELTAVHLREILLHTNIIPAPTVMLKTAWLRTNKFDTTYFLEDYPQWVKIVNDEKSLMYRPQISTYYRRLPESFSARSHRDYYAIRIKQDVIRCKLELNFNEIDSAYRIDQLRNGIDILQSPFLRQRRWLLSVIRRNGIQGVLYFVSKFARNRYVLRLAWFLSRFLSSLGFDKV